MTELFKLLGTIAIDNSEAKKALNETSSEGQKAQSKLGSAFSKMGSAAVKIGKTIATGIGVAATGVTALVTSAVNSYSSYEQLVGGVDTLFKNSSAKVQEYAKNAYATAGMSANEYMETVTSFSASLLQSLGGDTEKAAEKADMAITDMSDNANKMGTSMEMIQNAYQGFAKQNYTMLDNLKLGYGGTKSEMERLLADAQAISGVEYNIDSYADVVEAIHVIQTEMGITGTTAKEASGTITGSMAAMKGAWQNLMTAMASDDLPFDEYMTAFVNSTSGVLENMMPRIQTALQGVVQLVDQLAPIIINKIPELLSALLPSILQAATGLINSLVNMLPSLIDMLVNSVLPQLLTGIVTIFNAIIQALPSVMQSIVSALPTLIPQLIDGVVQMILTLCQVLPQIIQPIIDYLPEIIISIVDALMANLPALIQGGVQLIIALVAALPQIIQGLLDALPTIMSSIVQGLVASAPLLWEGIKNIWNTVVETVKTILSSLGNFLSDAWDSLGKVPGLANMKTNIETIWNAISNAVSTYINSIKNVVTTVWNSIKNVVSTVINSIKNVISTAWEAIKTIIKNVMNIIFSVIKGDWTSVKTSITNIINAIKSVISSVWNGIKAVISSVLSGIKNTVSSVFNGIKNTVSAVWNSIKTVTSTVWNGIKTAMTKPIQTARDTIKGIVDKIKGFFTGAKLEFPNIKLPHFSIKPSGWKVGDLLEGSIPKLGIEWYAKAMRKPMIMDSPTVFGYDAATGKLKAGGEAGSEVVSGTSTLMNMISAAVATQNEAVAYYLQKLIQILADYFPQVLESMDKQIVLDTGVLVGEIAVPMDTALGKIARRNGRGI